MVKMNVRYQGQKHCELTHGPSGTRIETDAPKDNQGKGEAFSPTDLVGAALASCILTTMAILTEKDGVNLESAEASVEKVMTGAPRRIESLTLNIKLPAKLTPEQRTRLEEIAHSCPVHRSLHPEVKMPMTFTYV